MDYTKENGKYYKVTDAEGILITDGLLEGDNVLSTIHTVTFEDTEEASE